MGWLSFKVQSVSHLKRHNFMYNILSYISGRIQDGNCRENKRRINSSISIH